MSKQHALIIDDEPDIRELLEITLSRMGLETISAANVTDAIDLLGKHDFQLCLTDMKLPDGEGLEIIEHIQTHCPETPVAMITAFGNVETAIGALKAGAFDFVNKPIDLDRLRTLVDSALKLETAVEQIDSQGQSPLLGEAPSIKELRNKITKLARSQAPVFISGESGSGKEVVARLIHANGPRSSKPFIPVNCGAIPTELVESEFFGHVKGSFTGASDNKVGLFEATNGGTLFLDEVADLPLQMQVKLLRAIQEKAIRKVGSNEEVAVNIRLLSATHKDLNKAVESGHFRSDLYYRINVIQLSVPPLRERREDIPLLADFSLEKLSKDWEMQKPVLADSALSALQNYHFPGNVRELENILERAFTLCSSESITVDDLQLHQTATTSSATSDIKTGSSEEAFGRLDEYLESIEIAVINTALEQTRWNKTAAAELLGISFRQLRHRIKKLNIDDS
jgi:two-component system response regulator PilR (NtrC family)